MRKLSVNDIVKHNENCYSFVIAVAKRARQIAEEAEQEGEMLDEKPVQMAVEEFVAGQFHIADAPQAAPEENRTQEKADGGDSENGGTR